MIKCKYILMFIFVVSLKAPVPEHGALFFNQRPSQAVENVLLTNLLFYSFIEAYAFAGMIAT